MNIYVYPPFMGIILVLKSICLMVIGGLLLSVVIRIFIWIPPMKQILLRKNLLSRNAFNYFYRGKCKTNNTCETGCYPKYVKAVIYDYYYIVRYPQWIKQIFLAIKNAQSVSDNRPNKSIDNMSPEKIEDKSLNSTHPANSSTVKKDGSTKGEPYHYCYLMLPLRGLKQGTLVLSNIT